MYAQISSRGIAFYENYNRVMKLSAVSGLDMNNHSISNCSSINLIDNITPTSYSSSTTKAPSYAACAEMINNIKSLIPSTSQFATKTDLNNYSREGHTHSQYVTTSYLASELQQTRQWVLANFKKI